MIVPDGLGGHRAGRGRWGCRRKAGSGRRCCWLFPRAEVGNGLNNDDLIRLRGSRVHRVSGFAGAHANAVWAPVGASNLARRGAQAICPSPQLFSRAHERPTTTSATTPVRCDRFTTLLCAAMNENPCDPRIAKRWLHQHQVDGGDGALGLGVHHTGPPDAVFDQRARLQDADEPPQRLGGYPPR